VPLPLITDGCSTVSCIAAGGKGIVTNSSACPIPQCAVATDCNDNNACTTDICNLTNPAIPSSTVCVNTPNPPCTGTDLCMTYSCDPIMACISTPVPVPANTTCASYVCISATGLVNYTNLCPPVPACFNNSQCNDSNACTTDVCQNPGDVTNAKCVSTPIPPCNDNNTCTYDSCVPATGCVFTPVSANLCDDNNLCTNDTCNPKAVNLTSACVHTPVVCNKTDVCHEAICDPNRGCLILDIVCAITKNCTISGCNITNNTGCYVKPAGVCGFPVGLVAGLAAGVIAGIAAAAVIGALMLGGGAAYAFTAAGAAPIGATVINNPLFTPGGAGGANPLAKNNM